MPVVIGGDNLPFPVGIGLTDMPNMGGPVAPLPPGFGITAVSVRTAIQKKNLNAKVGVFLLAVLSFIN